MRRKSIRICIMRACGTNCDEETRLAFNAIGVNADIVHVNSAVKSKNLLDYHGLVLPGGFAYGDYVRAGAILADILRDELGDSLRQFADAGRPILGICNGFQVLVETGLLPGLENADGPVRAALAGNVPSGYRCTWTSRDEYLYARHDNSGKCIFTRGIPKASLLRIPIAHAEGRVVFPGGREEECFRRLLDNDQVVLRFARSNGKLAEGIFPFNPNGSVYDIAGICNDSGTVMGLMPHPERAFFGYQQPDWTQLSKIPKYSDGKSIFESMVSYIMSMN
jgi:phosphoribosylformylglycinamidine synthase subunit PurQ / glutaminase